MYKQHVLAALTSVGIVDCMAPKMSIPPARTDEKNMMASLSMLSCILLTPGTPLLREGDVRLVAERDVANWVLGRPQILINGTWQQICAAGFDGSDSDVVCRQLGYGAGTVLPFFNVPRDESDNEESLPVGVRMPECFGDEETLLDCGREGVGLPWEFREALPLISGCSTRSNPGLGIACVAREEQGALSSSATSSRGPGRSILQGQ